MGRRSEKTTDAEVEKMRQDLDRWNDRRREAAKRYDKRKRPKRNDSPWREPCIATYGPRCVVCGDPNVEMDHIIPRSQGGKSVVENGLPLCGQWSSTVPGGHHGLKTAGRLKINPRWLAPTQLAYLAAEGWVDWDRQGLPFGRGYKHFTPRDGYAPPGS